MEKTTQILLLRHGQTDANAGGVLQGHQPTPLNAVGQRQAALLGARLCAYRPPVEILVSSDLPRALQTAGTIASACGLSVQTDPAWRERSFGLLEGKPVGDKEMWRAASGEMDPPGAEPSNEVHQRVRNALLQIISDHPGAKVIAIVTHGGPIRGILQMLNDGRLTRARGPQMDELPQIANGSILQLHARRYRDGLRLRIGCINDIAHLQDCLTSADAG